MSSAGEVLMDQIAAVLNAPGAPLPTVRQRPRPLAAQNPDGSSGIDAMLLFARNEKSQRVSGNRVQRERTFHLEIAVSSQNADGTVDNNPLDMKADPFYLYVVQTLFSDAAQAIFTNNGAYPFRLEEVELIWETASSYVDVAVCALVMQFNFSTTLDPSVRV